MHLTLSDREIDLRTGEIRMVGPAPDDLTTKEVELLRYLAGRAGEAVSRADLLSDVWGYAPTARTRAVDFTVRRLRLKIEVRPDEPQHILTIHGVGYRFEPVRGPATPAPRPERAPTPQPEDAPRPIGREREVQQVQDRLDAGDRLITVSGPPGIGTSTVAAAALAGRPIIRVDAADGLQVSVARALGVHEPAAPLGPWLRASSASIWLLDDAAASPADARAVTEWLRAAPDLTVVLASHAALGVRGERVIPVGPLDPESARAVARARQPDVDEASLGRLVEAADGFPLALALGLSDPVDARAAVAAALDVAWSEIGEPARQAWEMLASVAAPVELGEAELLLGEPAFEALEGLIRRGLVQVRRSSGTAAYHLQGAIRAYGLIRAASDTWSARRLAAALADPRPGPGALAEIRRACSTLAAARALAARGEVDDAVLAGLATAQDADDLLLRGRVRLTRGDPGGASLDAGRAVAAARGRPSEARIRALAGGIVARAGLLEGAARDAGGALRQALAGVGPADHAVAAEGFATLALVFREAARLPEAEEAVKQALHRARLAGDPVPAARTRVLASTIWRHRGRLDAAADALDQAEAVLEGGDLLCARRERAILDLERGSPGAARQVLLETGRDLNRLGWRREAAESTLGAAVCAWHDGRPGQAVDELTDAVHAMLLSGDRPGEGIALGWRAAALSALGDVDEAHVALAEATARLAPLDLPRARAVLHLAAAHVALARGDGEPARAALASAERVEASERAFGDEREMLRLLHLVSRPGSPPPAGP